MSPRKGAVLLMTLFLILLASFALSRFIERAYSEILAEGVFIERDRLRIEAYSALEATVGVLFDIQRIERSLYAPEQGWDDPLTYAGFEVPEGMSIDVRFEDEMGKIPLPAAERDQLRRLFEYLEFPQREAEDLADSLLSWANAEYRESSFASDHLDYEQAELPYQPPHRPMQSLYELAAIDGFREWFFDEQAVPNQRFYHLASLVSLFRFNQVNVNAASPEVLHIWSDTGDHELTGMQSYQDPGATGASLYFEDLGEASAQLQIPFDSGRHTVSTQCIRINVTVTEGSGSFRLSAVVAPGRGDQLRPGGRIQGREQEQGGRSRARRQGNRQQAVPYPFTFLEIRENEAIL